MKALQKASKFLSDYTSVVVIAIAVVTFFLPSMMGWVNLALFTDMVANKFTCQSIIIGIIMFSMGLTLTTEDFKILAQRPFDICVGAIAQYLIMPFLAFAISKALNLPDGIALGLILVGCCPGGVSSNIMSYLCGGDVAFSVGMTTVSTLLSPVMTPLLVSFLASGTQITIKGLPMFVSIIETVILPVGVGFLLNYLLGKKQTFRELQQVMRNRSSWSCMCSRRRCILTGSQILPVRCCNLCCCTASQWIRISVGIRSRKTGWNEHIKEENHLHRSWYAECRSGNKPRNNNRTVCIHTGIRNHLRCILHMALHLRNLTCRNVCNA